VRFIIRSFLQVEQISLIDLEKRKGDSIVRVCLSVCLYFYLSPKQKQMRKVFVVLFMPSFLTKILYLVLKTVAYF